MDEDCACRSMAAARLLQRALLAEVKGEMKAKRAQLLDTMRSMPDYSLQVSTALAIRTCSCASLVVVDHAPHKHTGPCAHATLLALVSLITSLCHLSHACSSSGR